MIRRGWLPLVGVGCVLGLLLFCYGPVLFGGQQFAYRDAAYFYYPLYQGVQTEWDAGRWPLWDPGQTGGVPLLGNPATAVLYPGKLIYACFAYPWAARLYVVAHTLVAFAGLLAFCRTCGVSWTGSFLGGLSYAFGAPVLFHYSNVIYLVGAAWTPWGLRALDRLFRQRRRMGAIELAAVLSLQVLGGEPEGAYLTAAAGALYALVLARNEVQVRAYSRFWVAGALLVAWLGIVLGLAFLHPAMVTTGFPAMRFGIAAIWLAAGFWVLVRARKRAGNATLSARLAILLGVCALAMAVSAAQILPALEFSARSGRNATGFSQFTYSFSVEPARLCELIWPRFFGTLVPENHTWLKALPRVNDHETWVASLYLGGLALALAVSARGFRQVRPLRTWLVLVALIAIAASFGRFGGPVWWIRSIAGPAVLGPHNPMGGEVRGDGYVDDALGSPYAMLATVLPGFDTFRYPGKLFTMAAVALAALAGAGWDRLAEGEWRRLARFGLAGFGVSVVGLAVAIMVRAPAVSALGARLSSLSEFGPTDTAAAWHETEWSLAYGSLVCGAIAALARLVPWRSRAAGGAALLFLTIDLAVANAGLIWTVPQSVFDAPADVDRRIATLEGSNRAIRIQRFAHWGPANFYDTRSSDRLREQVRWDRDTLRPFHGRTLGVEYTIANGTLDLYDMVVPFLPWSIPANPGVAETLGIAPGSPILYYPRRAFDLWGARYFVVPKRRGAWDSQDRGFASFLLDVDVVYPEVASMAGPENDAKRTDWETRQDWQILRNRSAYPRAWVVHHARVVRPLSGKEAYDAIHNFFYLNDPIWSEPGRPVLDLHATALVEVDDRESLRGFLSGQVVDPAESVTLVKEDPQSVELKASLKRPGLVILADTYYPGWQLEIDGRPASILRGNRMMRAAAVDAGEHTLRYRYAPVLFRVGLVASGLGIAALLVLAGWSVKRPEWGERPLIAE